MGPIMGGAAMEKAEDRGQAVEENRQATAYLTA